MQAYLNSATVKRWNVNLFNIIYNIYNRKKINFFLFFAYDFHLVAIEKESLNLLLRVFEFVE